MEVTQEALDTLGEIRRRSGDAIARRLDTWTQDDLELFATLLRRYNDADAT